MLDLEVPYLNRHIRSLAANVALDALICSGAMAQDSLPVVAQSAKRLRRELSLAWRAVERLDLPEARHLASVVESACIQLPRAASAPVEAAVHVLRASVFALSDNPSAALSAATQALRGPLGAKLQRLAVTICRYARARRGSRDPLYAAGGPPTARPYAIRRDVGDAFDLCIETAAAIRELKLASANRMALDALHCAIEVAGEGSTAAVMALTLSAQIAYEEGAFDRLDRTIQQIMLSPQVRLPLDAMIAIFPLMARLDACRGRPSDALHHLLEGERIGRERGCARLMAVCLREQVERQTIHGELSIAKSRLERLAMLARRYAGDPGGDRSPIAAEYALAQSHMMLIERVSREGIALIRHLQREALERNDTYGAAQLGVRLVDALFKTEAAHEARALLLDLLQTGMTVGLFQTFVDGGAGVRALLWEMYLSSAADVQPVGPLVRAIVRRLGAPATLTPSLSAAQSGMNGALTHREHSVLQLIGQGLSNKVIARDLHIAPETVKSHAKRIFAKLGTQTRTQCVSRAVKLGIL